MPARSNEFQELILVIQQHMAAGAVVTESKMLTDSVTGEQREVDVCIESTVAGHPVIVSVECRAHQRRQPVGFVEEMHAKHEHLPTSVLVLASESGFTAAALAKAKFYRMETVVPSKIPPSFSDQLGQLLERIVVKRLDMEFGSATLWVDDGAGGEDLVPWQPGVTVFDATGVAVMSMLELGQLAMALADTSEALQSAGQDVQWFEIGWLPEEIKWPDLGTIRLHLRKEEPGQPPSLRRITRAVVAGVARVALAAVPLTYGQLQGSPYAYGRSTLGESRLMLVMSPDHQGAPRITATFKPLDPLAP